jgi:hypothetical protein
MTVDEWRAVADAVASMWGKSARWAHAADAYRFAQSVPVGAAHQAVEQIYLENRKTTPAPADVLVAARKFITYDRDAGVFDEFCRANGHLWGITGEGHGLREVVCARCHLEETRAAHLAPTEAEIEQGVFRGDADRTTERIAP